MPSNQQHRPGVFITLDGGDGSGKSTVAKLLAEALTQSGQKVTLTREPGGCPVSETIRSLVLTGQPGDLAPHAEWLLFAAARAEHVRQTIMPALNEGGVVICDRWVLSTLAYQAGPGGVDPELVMAVHGETTGGLTADCTLLLEVPPHIGLARSGARLAAQASSEDRFEAKGHAYHAAVSDALRKHAGRLNNVREIDATAPLECVRTMCLDAVHEAISTKVDHHQPQRPGKRFAPG